MAMVLNLLHWLIDFLLRVGRGRILNNGFDVKASHSEIASELRAIVDQLNRLFHIDMHFFFATLHIHF